MEKMKLFDLKFRKNFTYYIFQSVLAIISLLFILFFLDVVTHTAIIASLGATVFIVFAIPKNKTARSRNIIGGHLIGTIIGFLCSHFASTINFTFHLQYINGDPLQKIILPAIGVGLVTFLMVVFDTEHPPAAGTTLGIIIQGWNYSTFLVILITTILLSIFHQLLNPWMKDLL